MWALSAGRQTTGPRLSLILLCGCSLEAGKTRSASAPAPIGPEPRQTADVSRDRGPGPDGGPAGIL